MTVSSYLTGFVSSGRRVLASRAELTVRILFYVVVLGVLSALWHAATSEHGGTVEGYTYVQLVWYVVAAEAAVMAIRPRLIEEIGNEIASGAIAVEMLRPVSVVGFRVACELGEAVARFACVLAVGIVLVLVTARPPVDLVAAAMFVPAALLAIVCNVAAQYLFGAIAFWLNDAKSAWFLYQKAVFLLGGMLIPLEFLPGPVRAVADALPFWTMAYAPARLLSGHPEVGLILGQVAWLIALIVGSTYLFNAGERRLQVVGG